MYQSEADGIFSIYRVYDLGLENEIKFEWLFPGNRVGLVDVGSLPGESRNRFMGLSRRLVMQDFDQLPAVCCFKTEGGMGNLMGWGMWRRPFWHVSNGRKLTETAIHTDFYKGEVYAGRFSLEYRDIEGLHPYLAYVETAPEFRRRGLTYRLAVAARAISGTFWGIEAIHSVGGYVSVDRKGKIRPALMMWQELVRRGLADEVDNGHFVFRSDVLKEDIQTLLSEKVKALV